MEPGTGNELYLTLASARARLVAAGVMEREAAVDVALFACTALGWDKARLLAELRGPTPAAIEPRFSEWLARREQREPSAYIIGRREFWGVDFEVSPAVLIPRPETEFVVEEALELIRQRAAGTRVAEIGTGAGVIAVALAIELRTPIVATDISGDALTVARANANRCGVADLIAFVETSYLDGIDGPFDLLVSNPPYVKSGDKPALSTEVQHEPDVALFGGESGMLHVGAVLDAALRVVPEGGWLVMEFGFGQDDTVTGLIARHAGLRLDHIRNDLQDIPRTAVVQRV